MRILVATDQWYPDLFGGVARVATETARRLALSGHEVVVIAPRVNDSGPPVSQEGSLTLARVLPRSWVPATISDEIATSRWANRLTDRPFDVLLAHNCNTAHGLLRAAPGVPLVYVFHADAAREQRYLASILPRGRDRLRARALALPLNQLVETAIDEATSVVVLSEFSRRLLRDRSPTIATRATVVGGAVDTDVFTPEGREDARLELGLGPADMIVFTVRRLVPRMGLENLVEAVGQLSDVEGLRVAIAGAGGLESSLRDLARERGLGDRLRFLGRVAEAQLPLWHRAADLFVLPTAAYEGFGLVTAEALASGTPVVGTPVGATPELLELIDPRLVARGTDADSLAEAIRTGLALTSPALRETCRAAALERYSWDAVMPEWERALMRAAAHPKHRKRRPTLRRVSLDTAAFGIRWSGAPVIARHVHAHERAGIVVYHDPGPETVERHLTALSRRHRFVRLDDLVDALRDNRWDDIPPKSIAVTIDDGFRGNADLVQVFAAFGVVPTVFLCSGIIASEQPFWWSLPNFDPGELKRVSNAVRAAKVERALADRNVPRQALSKAEIRALGDAFAFGAHTSTHPILPMCTDEEAEHEIRGSRTEVEQLTGRPCEHFAYPNGDFGPRELELVRAAGYRSSRTTIAGWVTSATNAYRLPILPMPDDATANRALSQVAIATFRPELLNRNADSRLATAISSHVPEVE